MKSRRTLLTSALTILVIVIFFWPISTRVHAPAVLEEARQQTVYPPEAAQLKAIFVSEGQRVSRGDPLFEFSIPELPVRIEQSKVRIAMQNARSLSAAGDTTERAEGTVIARILEEETENLSALQDRQEALLVVAQMDGEVRELARPLNPESWYKRDQLLARIVGPGSLMVRGYISEANLQRLDLSESAAFVADEISMPALELTNLEISDFAVDRLRDGYLAQPHGGPIAVNTSGSSDLVISGVWYMVSAKLQSEPISSLVEDRVQRGVIALRSKPQSYASRIGARIARVLIRELEF